MSTDNSRVETNFRFDATSESRGSEQNVPNGEQAPEDDGESGREPVPGILKQAKRPRLCPMNHNAQPLHEVGARIFTVDRSLSEVKVDSLHVSLHRASLELDTALGESFYLPPGLESGADEEFEVSAIRTPGTLLSSNASRAV